MKRIILPLIFLIIVNFINLTQWYLIDILTVFLMPILFLIIYILFTIFFIISIIQLIKNKFKKQYFYPLIINLMSIMMIIFIPYTDIYIKYDYKVNFESRRKFIKENYNLIKSKNKLFIPQRYGTISSGGNEIIIDNSDSNTKILFFTFRGILDNFSGYVYSEKDLPIKQGDFGADIFQQEKMANNWYWLSSR